MPIRMLRGYNSRMYFVEGVGSNMDDQIVQEVRAKVVSYRWTLTKTEVKKLNEGQVVALELDPENNLMTDSIYTYDRDLHGEHSDSNNDIMNVLYLLDGHEDVHKIVQERGQQGHHKYTVVDKRSVSQLKDIQRQMTEFKSDNFNTLSITARCMTINEVNYNRANGRHWDLDIRTREMRGKELIENDDDES